jgi:hypothetical protein
MRRTLVASLMALAGFVSLSGGCVLAQGPPGPRFNGPVTSPPFSPYLNLLRRGNPVYLNYYGLVRPELEFRNAVVGLQQQITANQQGISDLATATGLVATGHPTQFLNTGHYFLNRGGQLGSGSMRSAEVLRPATPNYPAVGTPRSSRAASPPVR